MGKTGTIICKNCNKEHFVTNVYSSKGKYCSQKCQHEYTRKDKIKSWLEEGIVPDKRQIKKYIIDTYGNKCYTCNIVEWNNKPIVFDLEHIDGNSENNNIENLCLICPNCHSQTPTYKGANKGNGRHYRRQRYAEGKSY
jgi:hypothetical protein